MSLAVTNTILELDRVTASIQHAFIIIGFEKNGMALLKILYHVFAGHTNIGEHTHFNGITGNDEAVGISSVMNLGKGYNRKISNRNSFIGRKRIAQVFFNI